MKLSQVIEGVGEREKTWQDFMETLPANEYRFSVFDLEFTSHDGMHVSKLFLCNWSPDSSPLKHRMLYATSKEHLKTYLDLYGKEMTISSKDEVNIAVLSTLLKS